MECSRDKKEKAERELSIMMDTAKLESQLGFDRIRKMISDRCSNEYAAETAAMQEFSTDVKEIRRRLVAGEPLGDLVPPCVAAVLENASK